MFTTCTVMIFNEYDGLPIPVLPFEYKVDRVNRPMPVNTKECESIYRTNVKVFEKDSLKREKIMAIFLQAGFTFVTGRLVTVHKNKNTGVITNYICEDRLIFHS